MIKNNYQEDKKKTRFVMLITEQKITGYEPTVFPFCATRTTKQIFDKQESRVVSSKAHKIRQVHKVHQLSAPIEKNKICVIIDNIKYERLKRVSKKEMSLPQFVSVTIHGHVSTVRIELYVQQRRVKSVRELAYQESSEALK